MQYRSAGACISSHLVTTALKVAHLTGQMGELSKYCCVQSAMPLDRQAVQSLRRRSISLYRAGAAAWQALLPSPHTSHAGTLHLCSTFPCIALCTHLPSRGQHCTTAVCWDRLLHAADPATAGSAAYNSQLCCAGIGLRRGRLGERCGGRSGLGGQMAPAASGCDHVTGHAGRTVLSGLGHCRSRSRQ